MGQVHRSTGHMSQLKHGLLHCLTFQEADKLNAMGLTLMQRKGSACASWRFFFSSLSAFDTNIFQNARPTVQGKEVQIDDGQ